MAPDEFTRVEILPRLSNYINFSTKLQKDFRECAQNEEQRQLILQVVEQHRKQNPSYNNFE
jgi:hypothetical protein